MDDKFTSGQRIIIRHHECNNFIGKTGEIVSRPDKKGPTICLAPRIRVAPEESGCDSPEPTTWVLVDDQTEPALCRVKDLELLD